MSDKIPISVVLGSYNRVSFLKRTISSIREEMKDLFHEIIVVDGGSTDGTIKWLVKQKDIITIIQHNRGVWEGKQIKRKSWGYFMNLAFKAAQGKYICMLSDDCLVVPGAIKNGYELFERKINEGNKVGAIAFYWRNWPEQERYQVGLTFGDKMFVNHGLYLKAALEKVGFIDEETYEFYHADGDLCLKMWQNGYACIDSPNSFIEHFSHANTAVRKSNSNNTDWPNYLKKWTNIFYNPALDNSGDWIYKDYVDSHKTCQKFGFIAINKLYVKQKFRIMRNKFRKIKDMQK